MKMKRNICLTIILHIALIIILKILIAIRSLLSFDPSAQQIMPELEKKKQHKIAAVELFSLMLRKITSWIHRLAGNTPIRNKQLLQYICKHSFVQLSQVFVCLSRISSYLLNIDQIARIALLFSIRFANSQTSLDFSIWFIRRFKMVEHQHRVKKKLKLVNQGHMIQLNHSR